MLSKLGRDRAARTSCAFSVFRLRDLLGLAEVAPMPSSPQTLLPLSVTSGRVRGVTAGITREIDHVLLGATNHIDQTKFPQAPLASRKGGHRSMPRIARRSGFIATRSASGAAVRRAALPAASALLRRGGGVPDRGLIHVPPSQRLRARQEVIAGGPAPPRARDAYRMARAARRFSTVVSWSFG